MISLGLVIGDGKGAREFQGQAKEWQTWMRARGIEARLVVLPVSTMAILARWPKVRAALERNRDQQVVQIAVFCHGWSSGIQFVHGARVKHFAQAIKAGLFGSTRVNVTLYCCTAGSDTDPKTPETSGDAPGGDGGFADLLRDALCAAGVVDCRVDAHTVLGHTTRNPYVRRFDGHGSPVGGVGGSWLVTPGSAHWHAWDKATDGELRWEFPLLEAGAIHVKLAAA